MWCTMIEFTTHDDAGCTPSNENWCLFLSSACDERDGDHAVLFYLLFC